MSEEFVFKPAAAVPRDFKIGFGDKEQKDATAKRREFGISLQKDRRAESLTKKRMKRATGGEEEEKIEYSQDQINAVAQALKSSKAGSPERLKAIVTVRQMLSTRQCPIGPLIKAGLMPTLVEELQHGSSEGKYESMWCMTNVSTGTRDQTEQVLAAAPLLIAMLSHADPRLREQAVWPLANIAGDDDEHRKTLIRNGVLEPLFANYIACVRIVTDAAAEAEAAGKPAAGAGSADAKESKGSSGSAQSQSQAAVAATLTLLHNVGWTLTNFLEGPKPPLAAFVKGRMLGACVLALRADQPDAQVASDAMWLIHLLVHRGGDEVAAALCEDGLVNALLGRLQRHTAAAEKMVNAITAELAKASGSASGGAGSAAGESKSGADGEAKQLGISGERAPEELRLHYDIVRSALRTVGHLAASGRDAFGDAMLLANKEMAAALLTSIGVCLQLHARRAHRSLGKESAWALANLAAGSQGRRADLIVQAGFVPLLAQLFAESKADVQSECLFALSNLAEHERHRELVVRHEGVLKTVLSCLRYADADVVRAALTFLQRALRSVRGVIKQVQELDGIEALETLQNSENEELWTFASGLVDEFYGEDYEDDVGPGRDEDKQEEPEWPAWRQRPAGT